MKRLNVRMMQKLVDTNHFGCFYYSENKQGKLVPNPNQACWAGVKTCYIKGAAKTIFISNYEREETFPYIETLVAQINKITPCEIVKKENKNLIKFKVLDTYDQSLVLLNFIRNLWHSPKDMYKKNLENFYFHHFFTALEKSKYQDGLKRLTAANKIACTKVNGSYVGHSNMFPGNLLKIKSSEELKEYEGESVQVFLCS